jgi:hypothetical protein
VSTPSGEPEGLALPVDPRAAREAAWEGFVRRMGRVGRVREQHRVLLLGSPGARAAVFWAQEFGCRVQVIDADASFSAELGREAEARGCVDLVAFQQSDPLAVNDLGLELEGFSVIYSHGLADAKGFAAASAALRPFLEPDGLGILRVLAADSIKETFATFPKQGYEPITCERWPALPEPGAAVGGTPPLEGWFVGRRVEASGPPRWPRRRSSE